MLPDFFAGHVFDTQMTMNKATHGAPSLIDNSAGCAEPFTIFLLSCRRFEVDWRVPLFDALQDRIDFYHLRLGRYSILTDGCGKQLQTYPPSMLWRLKRDITARTQPGTIPVYFVSMAAALPSLVIVLRLLLGAGIWLFDVYDDFSLYWGSLVDRLKGHFVNMLFYRIMTATIIAPPNLRRKFPRAYTLDIASSIGQANSGSFEPNSLIITSNLDGRLDYALIRELALTLPYCEIHIFGRVTNPARDLPQLHGLLNSAGNIKYYGEFAEPDFPNILANYQVALAPFQANVPFTRSTDPSRFYDYLNAGLEVISTDIPRARDRADFLHIANDAADVAEIYRALQRDPRRRKALRWNRAEHSWSCRSKQFLEILQRIALEKGAIPANRP